MLDNRIAVWALTGTSTLGTTNAVVPSVKVLASESYGQPPDAEQKAGPTPLKDAEAAGLEGRKSVEHLELLAGNDDRMNEVKYAAGKLWGDVNTVVKNANGNVNVGIAWFQVDPVGRCQRRRRLGHEPGLRRGQPRERPVRRHRGEQRR